MSTSTLGSQTSPGKPSSGKAWFLAIRPRTLAVGAAPVLVGAALAHGAGEFALGPVAAALGGSLLLQIASNLSNDVFDHLKGADTAERLGPQRAAQMGWLSPRQLAIGTIAVLLGSMAIGIYLIQCGGWLILAIGIAAMVCAVAYTGGPYPLGYLGLGELFVFAFFGPAAVAGTYLVQAQHVPPEAWIASIPMGLLAAAVLIVNNLRDRHSDAKAGKKTIAVRFGPRWTRRLYGRSIILAYAIPALWALSGQGGWGWLLPLLTAPLGLKAWRSITNLDGRALNPWLGRTAALELAYALLLCIGILLQ